MDKKPKLENHKSADLQTSFDFPPYLDVDTAEAFELVLKEAEAGYGELDTETNPKMTPTRLAAIFFQAGVKSGLFRNWRSGLMPDPDTDAIGGAMVPVITWAGVLAGQFYMERRYLPKVSFWQRVKRLWGKARNRPNSPKPTTA